MNKDNAIFQQSIEIVFIAANFQPVLLCLAQAFVDIEQSTTGRIDPTLF